jgi:hypothetical protein
MDFLSQLLRGPPSQGCAISALNVWPADAAAALKPRDRRPYELTGRTVDRAPDR